MERKSLKEELRETIDDLRGLIHKICTKENASSGELAVVPELANSITRMTGYAVLESDCKFNPNAQH